MKCSCLRPAAFVVLAAMTASSPCVVADATRQRTRLVRAHSNIFTNDDEANNVGRNAEAPTEIDELDVGVVDIDTSFSYNMFIEEEAVDLFDVAVAREVVPRDPSNMLTNQIIGGYQGWFAFPNDGAPVNKWRHWFNDRITNTSAPEARDLTVDMYPTTDEYDPADLASSPNILLPDGSPAKFFSSARPRVVLKHFEWMANYGITGIFHIRFMENIDILANRLWKDMVLRNVKNAADATGRLFAVSYNVAGKSLTNDVIDAVKNDWMQLVDMENITQSPRYIRQRGLPVLRIYGFGFKAVNVDDTARVSNLIKWFQKDAPEKYRVFLINGAPSEWRELGGDSRPEPAWRDIYNSFDGIHPWHVGRWDSTSKFDSYYANIISKDAAYCKEKGILYMPTMWPGFSWYNLKQNSTLTPPAKLNSIPREGGKFFWKQAHAFAANSNITTIWLAQIDEVDEGTAILKVVAKTSDLPVQGKWLPLDIDGQSVPSDWYLRLGGEAQKMFEGTRPLSSVIPIKPTDPPPPDALVNISANINDSNSTGNRGLLFTIKAKQNIFIRGLDIVARRTNAPSMSIYTRSGSYNNAAFTMDGWQQIFQTRIRSSQFGNANNILKLDDINVKVQIRAGQTQSFYIYNSNGLRFKPGVNEGGPHFEDNAIVVNEGRMTKTFFGNATVIGQFSGVVRYYIDRW